MLLLNTIEYKVWTITLHTLLHLVLRSHLSAHCEMCWYWRLSFFLPLFTSIPTAYSDFIQSLFVLINQFYFYIHFKYKLTFSLLHNFVLIFLPTDLESSVEWCILCTCSLYSVAKLVRLHQLFRLHQFSIVLSYFSTKKNSIIFYICYIDAVITKTHKWLNNK